MFMGMKIPCIYYAYSACPILLPKVHSTHPMPCNLVLFDVLLQGFIEKKPHRWAKVQLILFRQGDKNLFLQCCATSQLTSYIYIYIYIYMGQCPAKSPLWYFFKISRTSKRKVTLALKCMANYKFSA